MEDELLRVADEAARTAAAVLVERFGGPRVEVRAKSTPTDLVSEADLAAERVLREALAVRRPDDAVLGEEGGDRGGGATGLRWVVDPLDGTVNFLFGIPHWCVSVACEDPEGTLVGVVHDPLRDETFAATRSGPATLDGVPVRASERDDLATAMVATGFSYDADVRARQAEVTARVLPRVRDLRRLGSAALDLAWTACGRFDAYYERGLKPWDRAAGALLCRRAGLELREIAPADGLPDGLLAAPAALAAPLGELVGA
ncbi:MAG: monophosphatase [Solirubrobacteraceae bacterium]|jgi:myo-inositol-1(or 4)-monophosphatase|nr:monophosphatase [Solirubrobacteraceae bacterium]